MKNFFELVRNNSFLQIFSSKLIVQITTILQSIIISRLLGPEGKGEFTEIILWPSIIGSLSMLGLYTGIVRISAKSNIYRKYDVPKSVIWCTAITGIIGSIIAIAVNGIYFREREVLTIAEFYGIYVLIYNMNRGLSAINNGRGNMGIYSISSSILNPVYFICLLILLLFDLITLETCLISLLVANLCSCIFLFYKRDKKEGGLVISPLKMIKYSVKYSLADFSEPLYLYYDKVIVAFLLSSYELGLYTIAYSAAGVINIISSTFSVKLFSDVARGHIGNLFQYIRINIITMLVSALILCICLPILIPIVFGTEFILAIFPSLLLLPVCILQGQSLIIEKSILAKGYPYIGIKAKALAMAVLSILAVVLHLFQIENLISISILLILVQYVYLIYLKRKIKFIFKEDRIFPNREDFKLYVKRISSLFNRIS